ncbi:MAG: recombinase family protein [Owenweeksia sp.]
MITTGHRYFLYARKSSESEDRQMASIPDQVKEVQRLASELNLDIVEIITESRSAKAPGRPAFDNMLLRIQQGEANGILCWKLNRLARNPVDGGQISWMLQQGAIQHIQCYGRDYKPSDNVLMMQVEFGMANQYVKDLSVDVKRGMRMKAERGWYPSRSLPIGYRHNTQRKSLSQEILPDDNFNTIQELWKLMLSGDYSIADIKQKGDEMHLVGVTGKVLPVKTYRRIFTSKFYCGYFNWKDAHGVMNEYKGKHKAMVSLAEYKKVQKMLTGRTNPYRTCDHDFLFKGILKCGECGCSVTPEQKRHTWCDKCQRKFSCLHRDDCPRCHTPLGNFKIFEGVYYRCTKKRGPCSQRYVSEKQLREQYRKAIQNITIPEDFHAMALEILRNFKQKSKGGEKQKLETLRHQKSKLETRLKNLTLMRADGEISSEELKAVKDEIVLQIQEKELLIAEIQKDEIDWEKHAQEYASIGCDALETYDSGVISEVKKVLQQIGSNHTLLDQKAHFIRVKPLLVIKKDHQAYLAKKARVEPQNPLEK